MFNFYWIKDILKQTFQKPLWAFVIIALGFLLGLIPPFFLAARGVYWDNYKLVLLALVPTIYFGYYFFAKREALPNLSLHYSDIFWFLFLGISFLSYNWSVNHSLIWYPAYGWMVLILWMFMVRSLIKSQSATELTYFSTIFSLVFLIVAFHIFVVLSAGQLTQLERWNAHFGYTSNYVSAFLLALFPFFLFYNSNHKLIWLLKLVGLVFVFMIIQKANAKGSLIAFGIVIFYFLWTFLSDNLGRKLLIYGSIFGLFIFGLFGLLYFDNLASIKDNLALDIGMSHRLYILKNSIRMFLDAPFFGHGLGNWFGQAYIEDLANVHGYNHPTYYSRLGTHNLWELILVELGAIGLICFLIPFLLLIWKGLTKSNQITDLQKAAFASILVYLTVTFFYRDANLYEEHFSGLQLLTFCSIGILTIDGRFAIISNKLITALFGVFSLLTLVWFFYFLLVDRKYETAIKNLNGLPNVALLDDYNHASYFDDDKQLIENLAKTTQIMESIYDPIFKTTHGFYGGRRGANRLIPLHLAQLYQRQKKNDLAEKYYQKALSLGPNDELVFKSYARFLLRTDGDLQKAKKYGLKAYNIQSNNYYANVLLGETALKEGDFSQARHYLEWIIEKKEDYGFQNLARVLLAQIAFEEANYEKVKEILAALKASRNRHHQNQIKLLNKKLEQVTKNFVK